MNLKISVFLLVPIFFTIKALPIEVELNEEDPELISGYYEGDMILPEPRNGVVDKMKTWPMGMVFYKIEEEIFSK